ncbi:hypothetical protein HWV62_43918 [Athelia sp. TMB]|nr:hypothetical protein HWV62_43918 [Athelia sp. TMB]
MVILALPSFLALAAAALAAPSPRANHVIHEKRAAEPVDWIDVGRVPSDHILPMKFGLSQQNIHLVEEMLMAISHPHSPSFGSHMTAAEVNDAFAPSKATLDSVVDWLGSAGIAKERLRLTQNKAWVEVNATTAEIEELLNTEYHAYVHAETGTKQIGCHSYSVPEHISEHIDLIRPTVHFKHTPPASALKNRVKRSSHLHLATQHSRPSNHLSATANSSASLAGCSTRITPDCLRALYNINYTPTQDGYNSYGIVAAELADNSYEPSDLDVFYKKYAPSLVGSRPWLFSVDGGKLGGNFSDDDLHAESDLDIQYASVLAAPLTISLFEVATNGFDDWLDAVDKSYCTFDGGDEVKEGDSPLPTNELTCGVVAPPYVVSVSYGTLEAAFTPKYMSRQ